MRDYCEIQEVSRSVSLMLEGAKHKTKNVTAKETQGMGESVNQIPPFTTFLI